MSKSIREHHRYRTRAWRRRPAPLLTDCEHRSKGKRERWVPVSGELSPIVREIRANLEADDYVLPAQRWRDPGTNREKVDKRKHPMSPKALWELVKKVGLRAGIAAPLHPHLMRHAYADHVARHAGVRNARHLLGHAGIGTTETYLAKPTPEELKAAVAGFAFGLAERLFYPLANQATIPVEATTGIEPVEGLLQALEPNVRLYAEHFGGRPGAG